MCIETILVIDDNPQITSYLETLLSCSGFKTLICNSGQDGLKHVEDGLADLVLLDIVMPDINGLTLASQIKTVSGKDFLPVILLTALCANEDKVAGLNYADDYITKPFSGNELLARIKSLLRIRRLHRELSSSKTRYQCLYENFPHLYISIDSSRNITDCNRFFCQSLNVEKNDIVGRSIFSLFKAEDEHLLENFLNSLLITDLPSVKQRTFNLELPDPADSIVVNMKAVYMGYEEAGLAIVIAMEDITQQLMLQEEQKLARKQLYRSARLASIGILASGVAHELNNPLTAILGFSSALLDRAKNGEQINKDEMEQYLQIINMEALRCRDTVEILSKFAREDNCSISRVILDETLVDALKLTNPRAVKCNISILNEVTKSVIVEADAGRLTQVFVNIISNCMDFCNDGSTIKITEALSREPSRFFTIHISDNGPGIDQQTLPKVFDPFFTTKDIGRGTEMGLAICHKIMEDCNGSIDIISEKGTGTTVILDIPISGISSGRGTDE